MRIPARFVAQYGFKRTIMASCVGIGLVAIGAGIATRQAQGPEPSQPAAETGVTAAGETGQPVARMISGRERCTLGPNAAPDCRLATEALCRSKGYGSGTAIEFETGERCPPPYCAMDHFVTRALCQ